MVLSSFQRTHSSLLRANMAAVVLAVILVLMTAGISIPQGYSNAEKVNKLESIVMTLAAESKSFVRAETSLTEVNKLESKVDALAEEIARLSVHFPGRRETSSHTAMGWLKVRLDTHKQLNKKRLICPT